MEISNRSGYMLRKNWYDYICIYILYMHIQELVVNVMLEIRLKYFLFERLFMTIRVGLFRQTLFSLISYTDLYAMALRGGDFELCFRCGYYIIMWTTFFLSFKYIFYLL